MLTNNQINELITNGYTSVPQLKISNDRRKEFVNNIKSSGITGYVSNFSEHEKYLNENNINDLLKKQLMEVARDYFRIYCSSNDIYKITRVVKSTNISETYRFHFDSHLFTLVTPIQIPKSKSENDGSLILFPNIRKEPISEFHNLLTKVYYKTVNSYDSYQKLSHNKNNLIFNFDNFDPLLFLGRASLHANKEFSSSDDDLRITTLTHFFDPSPKYSIGNILRILRNR